MTIYKITDIEVQVVNDIMDRQKRGLNKYGVSVANNPLTLREWLVHSYEEKLDDVIYMRRAIAEIDKQQG